MIIFKFYVVNLLNLCVNGAALYTMMKSLMYVHIKVIGTTIMMRMYWMR